MEHGGRWRAERDWPLPDLKLTEYYLHADGRLAPEKPGLGNEQITYDFDPHHPVPSAGGTITSGEPVMRGGAYDQREGPRFFGSREPFVPFAARPDVLVFETAALAQDVEVTGPIVAKLWVSSDRVDTDFTIKLIDMHPPNDDYPEGFAMNVTDGILRVRYRDSWEHPQLLNADEVVSIKVEAFPTSNLFKRGHRIRLDVSSSNFPHFDVNPNTGAPEGTGLDAQIARNSVYLNQDRPSHVILPIVPPRV